MKPFLSLAISALFVCLLSPLAKAGLGNDNPTGPSGDYNGSITTAGSYDPYTGNAKRFVTDLTVTGSIGAYPLQWSRILNTRGAGTAFGQLGSWRHSYEWGMWIRPERPYKHHEDQYEGLAGEVSYPDGRKIELTDWYSYLSPSGGEPGDQLVEVENGTRALRDAWPAWEERSLLH